MLDIIFKVVKFAFKSLILYILLTLSKYCIIPVTQPEMFMKYYCVARKKPINP